MRKILTIMVVVVVASFTFAQTKPRAQALGVPFDGNPGEFNAITDVKGAKATPSTPSRTTACRKR